MKNTNTMRRVAGILYLVTFAVELYFFRPLYAAYSLMVGPIFVNALLIAAAGAGAVWMLAGKGLVNKTAARGVAVGTGLVVIKSLVLYELENELLSASLYELLPSLVGNNIWNYVFIILRLMLLIVAAFFVLNASEEPSALVEDAEEEANAEGEEEIVAEVDVVVAEAQDSEAEEKDRLKEIESDMETTLPGNDR